MKRELTPTEARGGVISGRVLTVLLASMAGGATVLLLAWAFLSHYA
jgi:hypothetical protein